MEQSKQQKAVLELGKLLVKELSLEKSVDTLSRWMAHHVAEKIKYAESLANGVKKKNAENECYSLILDLWKNRWNYKPGRQPLRDFNRLFDTIEKLNPEKEEPYFFQLSNSLQQGKKDETFTPSDPHHSAALALQLDKAARIWINHLLTEIGGKPNAKNTQKIIDRAITIADSIATDVRIIRLVYADSEEAGDNKSVNQKELKKQNKIKTLTRRLGELQKFRDVNEYLISQFENELNNLTK